VWGVMDSMGHVNNVMYVRYAESARVNWAWNYAVHIDPGNRREWIELCTPKGDGLILKSIGVEYKFVRGFCVSNGRGVCAECRVGADGE
jgi:hypothetical protein